MAFQGDSRYDYPACTFVAKATAGTTVAVALANKDGNPATHAQLEGEITFGRERVTDFTITSAGFSFKTTGEAGRVEVRLRTPFSHGTKWIGSVTIGLLDSDDPRIGLAGPQIT